MRILLSNDDGVLSDGLRELRRSLSGIARVFVVAPDHERTASGHSITVHRPLRAQKVSLDGAQDIWAVNGTPADCVKLALDALLPEPPDLVVSGINAGGNLGTDVLYSGTVAAAMEGAIGGVPSIAVSVDDIEPKYLQFAAGFTCFLCQQLSQSGFKPLTMLNVNIPNMPPSDIAGVEVTTLGNRRYLKAIHKRQDPRDRPYYWIAGVIWDDKEVQGTDVAALALNKISITPIHFDLTDHALRKRLAEMNFGQGLETFKPSRQGPLSSDSKPPA